MDTADIYDLLILVDGTYSMNDYLRSLQTSLPQIISISTLTDCFSRIGLLAYRDYCDNNLLEWSGWLDQAEGKETQPDLVQKAKDLEPWGGGDLAEALKTGLAKAYEVMRPEATTLILVYTDAPPHTLANGSTSDSSSNFGPEQRALAEVDAYGGVGPAFLDWVSAMRHLSMREGDKKAQVICILEQYMQWEFVGFFNYLATLTGGACLYLKDSSPLSISKVTVEVLLAWMGVEKSGVSGESTQLPASLSRYVTVDNMKKIKDEQDPLAHPFFATQSSATSARKTIKSNITEIALSAEVLKKHLPKKKTPVQDFAKRYWADEAYKTVVGQQLERLINEDVTAIALNPVFGSLWRALCNDRLSEVRDRLTQAFSLQVERISNQEEKTRMKIWLEESYDYTAEVLEAIDSVPEDRQFPCVYLDPTLDFAHQRTDATYDSDDNDQRPITSFRRDELLEIGRSCDPRVLRRLGRVLTRLSYVDSAADLPGHISAMTNEKVPKIPMALASAEYKRKFWKILLHVILPGTKLSARPAALLAALSVHLGLQPLFEAAVQEMLLWKDKWNDLQIPETWNVSCLGLLLDADQAYRSTMFPQVSSNTPKSNKADREHAGLLLDQDRMLFEHLVAYRMSELNLDTTLMAKIGWRPEKTMIPLGPVVNCPSCQYPRSVTIMGAQGRCGHCLATDYTSPQARKDCISARVTKSDNEQTEAAWVECSVRSCRAQYVVYNIEGLRVRSKCYYCRAQGQIPLAERIPSPAPTVECSECLSRIIWPEAYRPINMTGYRCVACASGRKSIVDVETSARKLSDENTNAWLIRNSDDKIKEVFSKRSLFHTISTAGTEDFCTKVELFPTDTTVKPLILDGKLIRNVPDIKSHLQSWIFRRHAEQGTCNLCFSNFRKMDLLPACGRAGCAQRICQGCLRGWYGLNAAGRIINTAALSCPFCRRAPTARTLAKYGIGVHAVANLRQAVEGTGQWIYAWCYSCGHAKQYMERICAAGAPPDVGGWACDECRASWHAEKGPEKRQETTKDCPGCGTPTQKVGGCDHMQCTVKGCGVHWCFFCGGKFREKEIYEHMKRDHGGYYEGQEYMDEDEYMYDTD